MACSYRIYHRVIGVGGSDFNRTNAVDITGPARRWNHPGRRLPPFQTAAVTTGRYHGDNFDHVATDLAENDARLIAPLDGEVGRDVVEVVACGRSFPSLRVARSGGPAPLPRYGIAASGHRAVCCHIFSRLRRRVGDREPGMTLYENGRFHTRPGLSRAGALGEAAATDAQRARGRATPLPASVAMAAC